MGEPFFHVWVCRRFVSVYDALIGSENGLRFNETELALHAVCQIQLGCHYFVAFITLKIQLDLKEENEDQK